MTDGNKSPLNSALLFTEKKENASLLCWKLWRECAADICHQLTENNKKKTDRCLVHLSKWVLLTPWDCCTMYFFGKITLMMLRLCHQGSTQLSHYTVGGGYYCSARYLVNLIRVYLFRGSTQLLNHRFLTQRCPLETYLPGNPNIFEREKTSIVKKLN